MAEGTDNVEDNLSCDDSLMVNIIWRFPIAVMVLIVEGGRRIRRWRYRRVGKGAACLSLSAATPLYTSPEVDTVEAPIVLTI